MGRKKSGVDRQFHSCLTKPNRKSVYKLPFYMYIIKSNGSYSTQTGIDVPSRCHCCQMKCSLLLLVKGVLESSQTIQAVATALACPPELEAKPLLLRILFSHRVWRNQSSFLCVEKFWLRLKMLCSLVGRKKSSAISPAVNTVSYSKDWVGKICLWPILTFIIASLWNIDKIVLCQY